MNYYYSKGVTDFGISNFEALINSGRALPQVNHIELHPWCTNEPVVKWCRENSLTIMGYCPLVRGRKYDHPFIVELSKKYQKTPTQILLRWSLQKGFVTKSMFIPKRTNLERLDEMAQIFDFNINNEDMLQFEELGKSKENGSMK